MIEDGTVSDCVGFNVCVVVPIVICYVCTQSGMELVAIRGLCLHCLRNCLRVQKNLNPIFAE